MKSLPSALWLCVSMAATAHAGICASAFGCRAAPSPEIGAGIPVALAVGAVLLATTLLARWRRV